jgi:hypothetical protein
MSGPVCGAAAAGDGDPRAMADGSEAPEVVPISSLLTGDSPRLEGEDEAHVRLLAASSASLPPVLVSRSTGRIIDGMHRLRAMLLRGEQTIGVRFFDGSDEEAFVAAVQANTRHGLPLTLADRRAAARRIIGAYPDRSDRWIAAITGLAAATVAAVRADDGTARHAASARVGLDGRSRPLSTAEARRIAADMIARQPGASLRQIAKVAGLSPETVRDVRTRVASGDDPVRRRGGGGGRAARPDSAGPKRPASMSSQRPRERGLLLARLRKDPSLRHTESGRALLTWLDATALSANGWRDLAGTVPPHSAYLLAELARGLAREWLELARTLETKTSGQR